MQCADKNKIIEYIDKNLTEKRRIHTYAVVEEAKKLANKYGEDVEKAEMAALFHDYFRCVSEKALNCYVKQLGLETFYLDNSNLAHSKIAAIMMKKDYHINDMDIINAVSYHTTGRAGMSRFEMIIYIADAIEINRSYPGVEEIRTLAYQSLEKACLLSLERSIAYINKRGLYLHKDTILARDWLLAEIKRKENEYE